MKLFNFGRAKSRSMRLMQVLVLVLLSCGSGFAAGNHAYQVRLSKDGSSATTFKIEIINNAPEQIKSIGIYQPADDFIVGQYVSGWHWGGFLGLQIIYEYSNIYASYRLWNNQSVNEGQTSSALKSTLRDSKDFRRTLFNNGATVNGEIRVVYETADGDLTVSFRLPDVANTGQSSYLFNSPGMPKKLKVKSVVDELFAGAEVPVSECSVVVKSAFYEAEPPQTYTHIGSETVVGVYVGDLVEISVPPTVYVNQANALSATQPVNAKKRYVGRGFSVSDVVQTGDPTLYRFTVAEDMNVSVLWREEFPLRIEQNVTQTAFPDPAFSDEGTGLAPVTSDALGAPSPRAQLHWIEKDTPVSAQVDRMAVSFMKPGLDIRYVLDSYVKETALASVTTQIPRESLDLRQQIDLGDMTEQKTLTYNWQVEFGVNVQIDDMARVLYPRVVGNSSINNSAGVYWFRPNTPVDVLIKKSDGSGQSVTGWMNGDGYYFAGSGSLAVGTFSLESASDVLHGNWMDQSADFADYCGLEVQQLKRPMRVFWRYGTTATATNLMIGAYVQLPSNPTITKVTVDGANLLVADGDMAHWDNATGRLYPLVPGRFEADYIESGAPKKLIVTVTYPPKEQCYPHIALAPPVNIDPDGSDGMIFKEIKYTENAATVDSDNLFRANSDGYTVLLFSTFTSGGFSGQPVESPLVKVVKTELWNSGQVHSAAIQPKIIGQRIEDDNLDAAGLKTGYLIHANANYNSNVYDVTKLNGLKASTVYDMSSLASVATTNRVTMPGNLPGPIIPVNVKQAGTGKEFIVIGWYADPSKHNGLLWPAATREYEVRWPQNASEGLGSIVIASQYGSESLVENGQDQVVASAVVDAMGVTNAPAATTYDPARIQQTIIYQQPDATKAGYNPNEEHALMAPSLRFAHISPRPLAAYALRDGDLNRSSGATMTSAPYVLTQFYDAAAQEFKMRVYTVTKEDPLNSYRFANLTAGMTGNQYKQQPHVNMKAGEPVIPFYPLGVVAGAVMPPETYGTNLLSQTTYWEDQKGSNWSVSGGTNAWFSVFPYYPLQPDFWWPTGVSGSIRNGIVEEPQVGDSLAFLASSIASFKAIATGTTATATQKAYNEPTQILYKSDWPEVVPILKAGETLTFAGGEYRADHPTTEIVDANGNVQVVETPGLPEVLAFAAAEVVFDSLDPQPTPNSCTNKWTARVAQVLEKRTANLHASVFPKTLSPASGRTRISQGKYVFNELPASLQKRVRYDSINGKLELFGLLNDKDIGDSTLTAPPPAVYVLEPNILTAGDIAELKKLSSKTEWTTAIDALKAASENPSVISGASGYLVGLQRKVQRNAAGTAITTTDPDTGIITVTTDATVAEPLQGLGPGLALLPNANFMDPANTTLPVESYITLVENNDASLGGSPITPHIIKIDRRHRYRGAIKTVLSDNVFDENVVLRHQGDFGANAKDLVFEWWYRPDDGSLNVPPPDFTPAGTPNPWKLFPDTSGNQGVGRYEVLLKGDPQTPETLLADSWWFCRYRHVNDKPKVDGIDWSNKANALDGKPVNFTWAGAGNSDPFNDFDFNGVPDFKAQLAMGWLKRVLDAVNPYEARIRDFEGDSPSTVSSMMQQFGPRFEGPVALNPDKNVIENVGLIALYETLLKRGRDLSINLSRPISTPALANALQLASTRISDFYMLLGNEAYTDAQDPTIGFGSSSVEYGHGAPAVFSFQNQLDSVLSEELAMLRGLDDNFARPVYNRLFWNFTKGEGEAAYALNYNISDINADGFIDEDDAMILYPQGHGDAWGHYLTATRKQYDLLKHKYFNWVSRSEFYNLMDIVIKVDFLDERKFAQAAAAKAKAGTEIVNQTYRSKYVEDPTAQWQGYRDSLPGRAWGVQGWARRAGQGAYFDWMTANALLPAAHPDTTLEGIQKVDRQSNSDIAVISANLNAVQRTFDDANSGYNPLGISKDAVVFDVDPVLFEAGTWKSGSHFEQIYGRAIDALGNTKALWDYANQSDNRLRKIANTEAEFRNSVFQEDLSYKNRLIEIFGKPYEGTIGSGKLYPAGYDGPDLALYMYVNRRTIDNNTVPGPTTDFATFSGDSLSGGAMNKAFTTDDYGQRVFDLDDDWKKMFAPTFLDSGTSAKSRANDNLYAVNYTDISDPKVELTGLAGMMPVTTAGYTFQAPTTWGNRLAGGELQSTLQQMLIQEAKVAEAIASWDGLAGEIIRTLAIIDARISVANDIYGMQVAKNIADIALSIESGITEAIVEGLGFAKEVAITILEESKGAIPKNLPTGGFSISPGDALAPLRAAIGMGKTGVVAGMGGSILTAKYVNNASAKIHAILLSGFALAEDTLQNDLAEKEWLKELEDLVGDEPIKRVSVFKEIEALRGLSSKYRRLLDEGARLVDERAAYNKRVAAATQLNRYQDMTFRVSRNHALRNYRASFDLAAKYAYLAAKAYDYETSFESSNPGSPQAIMKQIVQARSIGLVSGGEAQMGSGGLAESMAWMKINYDTLKGQLGFNNPQHETGKMSLRTELFRIVDDASWEQQLKSVWVDNLWEVPEFRTMCRPSDINDGTDEPGLVIRFRGDISSKENFFGHPLSGGDHAYNGSVFATKIRAAGIWFSDYQSSDVNQDLAEAPQVYLLPAGIDLQGVAGSDDPTAVREWKVFDQRIPVPLPALDSELDQSDWAPLYDSLSGLYGEQRRFSSFRAYHDGGEALHESELVYDSRLVGRSVRNTEWVLIIPGSSLHSDPEEGLKRFIEQVSDIKLLFKTYGFSGN